MLSFRPQSTDPLDPCVNEQQAADWLLIDSGMEAEFKLMTELVRAAMDRIETICKQPVFSRKFYGYGSVLCDTQLHSLNVTDVEKIDYQVWGNATWVTLDAGSYIWTVDGEIKFSSSVRSIRNVSQIRVSYTAGFEQVPQDIIQAVRLLIGRWYEIRADEKREVPSHAEWLIKNYVLPIL